MIKKLFISLALWTGLITASVQPVFAGTNLTVTCNNNGPCSISPAGTPLFNETNAYPGQNFLQTLTITNNDSDESCNLLLDTTDTTPVQAVNLAERIFTAIESGATPYFGIVSGGMATPPITLQNLYDSSAISLGGLSPGQTRVYDWHAQFDPTAGNEYQDKFTRFDVTVAIECDGPAASPNPTDSPGGSPNPSSNPGSPSPSSSSTSTTGTGGSTNFFRSVGGRIGQVLGVQSEEGEIATDSGSLGINPVDIDEVVEDTLAACAAWKVYIPWVLLIAQAILLLLSELFFRRNYGWTKHFMAIFLTLASIALFYWLRECNCARTGSWWLWLLVWLCTWYWLVALILTLLIKFISYLFIEDEVRPVEPAKKPVARPTRGRKSRFNP